MSLPAPARPSRRARWLAVALSLLFALAAAELAVRLAGIGRAGSGSAWYAGGNHPRGLVRPDARTGYALTPGFAGEDVATTGEFRVPVRIDSQGLRDHPHRDGDAAGDLRARPPARRRGERRSVAGAGALLGALGPRALRRSLRRPSRLPGGAQLGTAAPPRRR